MSRVKPQGGTHQKEPPGEDPKHLDFIRALPCIITDGSAVPAHVRFADARFGKTEPGKGKKPHDKWTVPLCPWRHTDGPDAQHKTNERVFWKGHNIDVLTVCMLLYDVSGDIERGRDIIARARRGEFTVEDVK